MKSNNILSMDPISTGRRRTLLESTMFKLLLLLVMFQVKHKKLQEEWDRNYKLEREIFEKNHKKKIKRIMDDMERIMIKRARFGVTDQIEIAAAVSTQQSVQKRSWVKDRSQVGKTSRLN